MRPIALTPSVSRKEDRVKPALCSLAVTIAFFWLVPVVASPSGPQTSEHSPNSEPASVGMVALLAAPEKYDGVQIRTFGFLRIEFEGNALYLHQEDYRNRLRKNALELNLSAEQEKELMPLNLKYVVIEGTVSGNRGVVERGMYSGALGKVTRVEYWHPRSDADRPRSSPPE
jgi:hypothetical protein